ncbi:MAG: hypothetical protein IJ060_03835 [Oscillospiraceae bacterium]|nr:hypothetical protein [Oscillospiraceae bacterium]
MKAAQLYELIGELDEAAVYDAAQPRSRRRHLIAAGLAAAACLGIAAGIWGWRRNSAPAPAYSVASDSSEALGETAVEFRDVRIYYYHDGEMQSETEYLPCTPERIFAAWKARNGVGDEVRFIACRIESNGTEHSDSSTASYTVGDTFILHLTVSAELAAYYDKMPPEQLQESLRLTMTGYSEIEYDGFDLKME